MSDCEAQERDPRSGLRARYCVPKGTAAAEQVIRNSVFVATVGHAANADAARAFVSTVADRYHDASHNAWAFRISDGPQAIIGSSDDGEPGGTAGRPMLAVLTGSGLVEVVAVGTRYFGGTKLGTGGLVRAYGGVVREALKDLSTVTRVLHHVAVVTIDYPLYGSLQYLIGEQAVVVASVEFAERVQLELAVPWDNMGAVGAALQDLSHGAIMLGEIISDHRYLEK